MGRRALASPAMRETTVAGAMTSSLKAVLRESWLASLGMAVTIFRGLYVLPAAAFATAVAWIALRAAIEGGNGPEEALAISAMILASPRARAIALGLWLSGWLLWGALRVAWITGSLSTLAGGLSGEPPGPRRFATAVAYRFDRVLVSAVWALALDLLGQAMVVGAVAGALVVFPAAKGSSASGALSAVVAAALAASIFLAVSLSVLGDATIARAAIAGDRPGRALGRAAAAFARRPAAFVAASLGVLLATALAVGSLESLFGIMASAAAGAPRVVLVAPQVLLAGLSALLAAFAELWRLSAIGVLALGGDEAGLGASAPASRPAR